MDFSKLFPETMKTIFGGGAENKPQQAAADATPKLKSRSKTCSRSRKCISRGMCVRHHGQPYKKRTVKRKSELRAAMGSRWHGRPYIESDDS